MPSLKVLLLLITMLLLAAAASAQGVKVIANSSIQADSISPADLRSVFLEDKSSLPGIGHVEPVLAKSGPAHEDFVKHVLGRNDSDLQLYYRSLIFTGRGFQPKTLDSDQAIVAYVAKTRGAIGYINSSSNAEGVHVLDLSSANGGDRKLIVRIEPDYPPLLHDHGIGGTVRLQVTIAPNGSVKHADLRGGDAALGEAAIAAVRRWKYAPSPSETETEVSITFDPKH